MAMATLGRIPVGSQVCFHSGIVIDLYMLGSQTSKMGEFEIRQRLIVVRRLLGNDSIGPSAVWVQSIGRISSPISPPPSQCFKSLQGTRTYASGARGFSDGVEGENSLCEG
jgi:hypothetical protein